MFIVSASQNHQAPWLNFPHLLTAVLNAAFMQIVSSSSSIWEPFLPERLFSPKRYSSARSSQCRPYLITLRRVLLACINLDSGDVVDEQRAYLGILPCHWVRITGGLQTSMIPTPNVHPRLSVLTALRPPQNSTTKRLSSHQNTTSASPM